MKPICTTWLRLACLRTLQLALLTFLIPVFLNADPNPMTKARMVKITPEDKEIMLNTGSSSIKLLAVDKSSQSDNEEASDKDLIKNTEQSGFSFLNDLWSSLGGMGLSIKERITDKVNSLLSVDVRSPYIKKEVTILRRDMPERAGTQAAAPSMMVSLPCDCAQRWTGGATWNVDGTIDDTPNANDGIPNDPVEGGVIRCGSAAETQSNIKAEGCTYDSLTFPIDLSGVTCFSPSTG
ncbi:MAG: hypothetical protein R3275_13135, partial [Saprospiraceae bacterium]|nr:hypothetical protein [Saprospiraceae bacterium]